MPDTIEDRDLRRDVAIGTIRIQPGVTANIVGSGKTTLSVGGGLTIARITIDDLFWNGTRVDELVGDRNVRCGEHRYRPFATLAFHAHLAREVTRPSYGDLAREGGQ